MLSPESGWLVVMPFAQASLQDLGTGLMAGDVPFLWRLLSDN
jgi:hypothetical protein